MTDLNQLAFFLGGRDLEMATIAELLAEHAPGAIVFDKKLSWGAKASDYAEELQQIMNSGRTAVLIELEPDLELPAGRLLWIDHHNERAGVDRPTSLEQTLRLLDIGEGDVPPDTWRHWQLVSANDKGHIREMLKLRPQPTQEEMIDIRRLDRSAVGVTEKEEAEAKEAIERRQTLAGGELTVVHLSHQRASAVADLMDSLLGGPGFENLLVQCPGELYFWGAGGYVNKLHEKLGGFKGGALPERGFWGKVEKPLTAAEQIEQLLFRP